MALGAGPSGFPKQVSERSFRDSHSKPAPSLAHAPLFWRWGLARRASRNKFPSDAKRGDLEAAAAYAARSLCRNTGGPDYEGRAADGRFHIVPYKEFISGQAEQFFRKAGKANGNFIKARQPQWPFYESRWPFYQVLSTMAAVSRSRTRPVAAMAVLSTRSGQMTKSLASGCGWPISYCPV